MSTPRRSAPRSIGTPMIEIRDMFSPWLARPTAASSTSRVETVKHARERYGFTNVLEAADPRDRALDSHAEACVRHRPELAQIQIPFEHFAREFVFHEPLY